VDSKCTFESTAFSQQSDKDFYLLTESTWSPLGGHSIGEPAPQSFTFKANALKTRKNCVNSAGQSVSRQAKLKAELRHQPPRVAGTVKPNSFSTIDRLSVKPKCPAGQTLRTFPFWNHPFQRPSGPIWMRNAYAFATSLRSKIAFVSLTSPIDRG